MVNTPLKVGHILEEEDGVVKGGAGFLLDVVHVQARDVEVAAGIPHEEVGSLMQVGILVSMGRHFGHRLVRGVVPCGHSAVRQGSLWGCSWVASEGASKAHHCYQKLRHTLACDEPQYASALCMCQTPCTFYHPRGGCLSECLLRGGSVLMLSCKMKADLRVQSGQAEDIPWMEVPCIHGLHGELVECNPCLVANS